MSNHPYRQKAPTTVPYPVFNHEDSSTSDAKVSSPVEEKSPENKTGNYSGPSGFPSNYNSPLDETLHFPSSNTNITNGAPSSANTVKSPNLPYPTYETQTPSPVFASKDIAITSPPSNPLSTTSSVTNFNLNQPNTLDSQAFSKSETNLVPLPSPSFTKFGHNRSVSSTSSFFYDRSDNASLVDFSQNVIQQYLGSNSTHLLPRIRTIELYRKNAKKSNDPTVLFQYAQYMLQTALIFDTNSDTAGNTSSADSNNSQPESLGNSPKRGPLDKQHSSSSLNLSTDKFKKSHSRSKSPNSIDFAYDNKTDDNVDDKRLKKALLKEAVHYLKKLSDKGYVDAQYLLADAHSSGALGKIENREAFVLFQSAAKHGHVESAYRTSYCYEEGLGTGRDARKAVEYLKMAASKNHPAAMYKLGVYSFYGRMGLSSHINTKKMGIKWLTRAANVANELIAAAPYELGKIYFNGFQDIVIADKKYALELYSQAAALGHIQSAALLGQFYEVGEIVPQDSNLSIHYYTQAALGGDPESMLAMCAWYLVGSEPFLPKDESEAFEWAKRAAMCNLTKAQFALANFYERGIGCIKNVDEAQVWYKNAAENGDVKSLARLADTVLASKLEKKMKKKSNNKKDNDSVQSAHNSKIDAQDKNCIIM